MWGGGVEWRAHSAAGTGEILQPVSLLNSDRQPVPPFAKSNRKAEGRRAHKKTEGREEQRKDAGANGRLSAQ